MTLTRVALNELLDTLMEQLIGRLATDHDPLDIALWLERRQLIAQMGEAALDQLLKGGAEPPDTRVHALRKHLKKARAALRLACGRRRAAPPALAKTKSDVGFSPPWAAWRHLCPTA